MIKLALCLNDIVKTGLLCWIIVIGGVDMSNVRLHFLKQYGQITHAWSCVLHFVLFLFCFCFCFFVFAVLFLFLMFVFDVTMLLMSLCSWYKNLVAAVLSFSVFVFLCMGCLSKFFRLDFQRVVRSGFYSTFLYYWSLLWLVFLPFFVLSCF